MQDAPPLIVGLSIYIVAVKSGPSRFLSEDDDDSVCAVVSAILYAVETLNTKKNNLKFGKYIS